MIDSDMVRLCDCLIPVHKKCIIKLLQTDLEPYCWICGKTYNIDAMVKIDLFLYRMRHLFDWD